MNGVPSTMPPGPKDLIFTLFGDYIHHRGGEIWTGSLIALLQALGVASPQAVRAALSRMTQKGWLRSRRIGRRSYYSLAEKGQKLFAAGDKRIFASRQREWDGYWRVLTYRIPEDQTRLRTRLRRELGWIGFGRFNASFYIAPYDYTEELEELMQRLPVCPYVDQFVARYLGPESDRELVGRVWELPKIHETYEAFIARYRPLYERDRAAFDRGESPQPENAFVCRFMLIHEFRQFPFIDPDLPPELLPEVWPGVAARRLFHDYHAMLTEPALAYFNSVYQAPGDG